MARASLTRILVVEDSPVYRKLISNCLEKWEFEVVCAQNGEDAWKLLQQHECPKLALVDWVLPDIEGIELCRRIRGNGASATYIYVMLLTGKNGRENMLTGLAAGADDYLVKPFDELELKARLLVGQRIVNLQEDLILARESMRHAATHDGMTGLMNRAEILHQLERELARAKREHKPLAVVMADIDHFKNVNDVNGHLFGDSALTEVARRLKSKLRVYDAAGRYGGEEFLLILPGCDQTAALIRADQLRSQVASTPINALGKVRTITVSMGLATADGSSQVEIESLLAQADAGLYEAKKRGRNRVENVDPAEPRLLCDQQ